MISQRDFLKLLAVAPLAGALPARGDAPAINWSDLRQTMDGFGASAAFHQAKNLQNFGDNAKILDLLFSVDKGVGLTIVRNIVGDGGDWGKSDNGAVPSIEPREGVWDWSGDDDQIWFMQEAAKRGAQRNMSTVWSPPAWMKDSGSVLNGGHLKPEKYRAFAEYLSAYVRGYKEHYGIDIYAISPTNEPDQNVKYSSCLWSGEQLHVFVRDHVVPVFARDNVQAKFLLGEYGSWNESPLLESLADPVSAARIDICAAHAYSPANKGYEPIAWRTGVLPHIAASGKPLWQTEVSAFDKNGGGIQDALYWAKVLHTHVVENNVSAWLYWWAINQSGDRSALIWIDDANKRFAVAQRLFAIGHYSRYVRSGFRRVATTNPASGVFLSAFTDSKIHVVVAINENAGEMPLSFLAPAPLAACNRTSATGNMERIEYLAAKYGMMSTTLAAQSITSIVM